MFNGNSLLAIRKMLSILLFKPRKIANFTRKKERSEEKDG